MLIKDLEAEGYDLKAGCINPVSDRNVKKFLLLSKGKYKYLTWSFDGENFTIPTIISMEDYRKCVAQSA